VTFAIGAVLPLLVAFVVVTDYVIPAVAVATLVSLALLGALGAQAGGANIVQATLRVTFWGLLAMAATAAIGALFGTTL
jgi:VIT1/CCC1 family predicted Fe2+/Mn2+ transporter